MEYTQFIAGEFRPGTSEQSVTVINPSDAGALGQYACASEQDVREAIDAAADAWRTWRKTSALERAGLLRRVGALMRERRSAIAEQISMELGKPFSEAQREVDTAAEMFEWSAEEARRIYGRTIPPRGAGISQTVELEPIGPVAAFAGWNAPAITPSRKISSALAAGCTIVIKPSEETAGVALAIARAVQDAGVPDGVLNMVFGDPAGIADQLCAAPDIAMVTFTGATSIGKQLGAKAALTMKRATLELGGHAPVIVCADSEVERVAGMAVATKYRNAGQVCTSPTRFFVEASAFESFSTAFVQAAQALRVGDPFDSATQMGPLKNLRRLQAIDRMVQDASDRGGRVAAGGRRLNGSGFFYAPTVVVGPDPASEACQVEPFGPLALLSPFDTLESAIAQANSLPFGLAAYAFTNSLQRARRLSSEIESGVVCINEWQASLPETPFGGTKDSGLGSEGGTEGLHEFLRTKCVRVGVSA
ncbi:succinate-semialdehyde dehydrogenase/glutarate-semialdehyde dehydrogenase [Trinickia symbiotica]|uniref:NAD-dependent succinate-semialdehyde dehydrogenase n=1 Tax=Trinickia symbiotica TaxID=863227 RepID=A0A2N7WLA2_9BURK|nr:NAD-dependent succinate-semialdehyde dehydrogenase [Trinickia symbiotica]PMS30154.1 NAD-dependent succinate-semialdehyde dehydrogenase [Trinickia symbiotica]PPK41181.1 succinate-semialdehyde dehydrogenase/glutarate-semialdehyde dehydrogenase [Trinickia symbiotica]